MSTPTTPIPQQFTSINDQRFAEYKKSESYKKLQRKFEYNWPHVERILDRAVANGTYDRQGNRLKPIILPPDMQAGSTTDVG